MYSSVFMFFVHCHTAKRMPAHLLLQSPWFSEEQDILHHDDAIEGLRQHLEQNTTQSNVNNKNHKT